MLVHVQVRKNTLQNFRGDWQYLKRNFGQTSLQTLQGHVKLEAIHRESEVESLVEVLDR